MDRRLFLKRLGAGACVASALPSAARAIKEMAEEVGPSGVLMIDVDTIPDGYTIEEIMEAWKQYGVIPYQRRRKPAHKYIAMVEEQYFPPDPSRKCDWSWEEGDPEFYDVT